MQQDWSLPETVCRSKKTSAVHKVEKETIQDKASKDIETLCVYSVQLNTNGSIITTNLKTLVGKNSINMPYKIDKGSNSNIMPVHVFKKLFPDVTNDQLVATVNKHIMLKMYNKSKITQLGTCKIVIEHKNNKKTCQFFVVSSNGQALLGMPDRDALNIININIDTINAEVAKNKGYHYTT